MSQSNTSKPGLRSRLLLGLGLVSILVIESCICCTGALDRRIGRDDLRREAEKRVITDTKNLPAPSLPESPLKSNGK